MKKNKKALSVPKLIISILILLIIISTTIYLYKKEPENSTVVPDIKNTTDSNENKESKEDLWVYFVKGFWWTGIDTWYSVAVDKSWNTYITWYFSETLNVLWESVISFWGNDIFLLKLDNSWNLVWVKSAWGTGNDIWNSVAIDSFWNIYITWYFSEIADIFWEKLKSDWGNDIFISKLDSSWDLIWTKKAWWNNDDVWNSVAIDSSWNVYITWYFLGKSNIFWEKLSAFGGGDIFISKLDSSWNLVWAKNAWWSDIDIWYSVKIDNSLNIYITWYFRWTTDIFWESLKSA